MNINEIYNRFCLRREDLVRFQGCDDSESIEEWDADDLKDMLGKKLEILKAQQAKLEV